MTSIKEFMSEKKLIDRWAVIVIAMTGAFAGAILMFMVMLAGILG